MNYIHARRFKRSKLVFLVFSGKVAFTLLLPWIRRLEDFYRFTQFLSSWTLLPSYAKMHSLLPYPHPMAGLVTSLSRGAVPFGYDTSPTRRGQAWYASHRISSDLYIRFHDTTVTHTVGIWSLVRVSAVSSHRRRGRALRNRIAHYTRRPRCARRAGRRSSSPGTRWHGQSGAHPVRPCP